MSEIDIPKEAQKACMKALAECIPGASSELSETVARVFLTGFRTGWDARGKSTLILP